MFRSLLHLICSAWIAAVLMVSPALAALDCGCCQPTAKVATHAGSCEHCQPPQRPDCCEPPAGPTSDPCHECPKCQLRQGSVPATAGSERVVSSDAPLLVVARIELPARPIICHDSLASLSEAGHSPPPTLMVLNCRWQK